LSLVSLSLVSLSLVSLGLVSLGLVSLGLFMGCDTGLDVDGDATPQPDETIEIVATEYAFEPDQFTVSPGGNVTIVLINQGQDPHNIAFEFVDGIRTLDANVPPGGEGRLELEVPDLERNYTFYCPVGDHFQLGMEGTMVVAP